MQARKSELEREVLRLPPQKRARLLRLLLESLDDEAEADVEAAWIEEAKLRYEELRSGRVKGRTATQVHERARAVSMTTSSSSTAYRSSRAPSAYSDNGAGERMVAEPSPLRPSAF
jgi:putative addiction module component (TIGR02574 family)